MLMAASWLLIGLYVALPAASIVATLWRPRRLGRLIYGGWVSGAMLAAILLGAYAFGIGGQLPVVQGFLAVYFAVGLMLFLKTLDALLTGLLRRIIFRRRPGPGRAIAISLTRLVLFGGFALPWVMAAAMVYRPRVVMTEPPVAIDLAERVFFPATDGQRVAAWFVPAGDGASTTALLCHGLGGNTAGFFRLIDALHDAKINVLAIDLRAHGESSGQLCTFGYRERDDVNGAVEWLKGERPEQAERIVGVGASLGAAALLSAAKDEPHLDGVAVLSTYATLPDEVQAISRRNFVPPFGWLVRNLGLPFASLHIGIDLRDIRPIDDVRQLWPRPVLIVHGTDDEIIPFEQGRQLYDAAPIGRWAMWVQHGTHNGILDDRNVIDRVIEFIQLARRAPVV